jgi:hypothetical protein
MTRTASAEPVTATLDALVGALADEQRRYADLLNLARQQGTLMTTHDLDGLDENSQRIGAGLAAAEEARIRRERLAAAVMAEAGVTGPETLSNWLTSQPRPIRDRLVGPVQAVRRAAGELARANEANRRLANFCLDLVEEEATLLRRCLLEDPAGRYDRGARPTTNGQGGVLRRQA